MGRKFLVINLLILGGVVLLSRYLTSEWKSFEEQNNVQRVLDKAKNHPGPIPDLEFTPPPLPAQPYPDFTVIPEKDLFMAERRPPQPEQAQVVEPPPAFAKPPALNGVLNGNGKTQALMTIFDNPNAKGQSRVMSIGDIINGWSVAEIKETSVTLRWKDQEKLIDMFDNTVPPQTTAVASKAVVTVITIGSSVAAVETVEASAAPGGGEENRGGLVVGVAGGQGQGTGNQGGQRGGQGGLGSRGGRGVGAAGSRSGRGGMSGQGGMQGGAGVMGVPGGGGSVPFNSGVRR